MFYEDVVVEVGDTLPSLAVAYGYRAVDADKIWKDTRNAGLVRAR